MYSGNITLLGNPDIHAGDTLYITDDYNDISGPVEVRDVMHFFSHQTGFITVVKPAARVHLNQLVTLGVEDTIWEIVGIIALIAGLALTGVGVGMAASALFTGASLGVLGVSSAGLTTTSLTTAMGGLGTTGLVGMGAMGYGAVLAGAGQLPRGVHWAHHKYVGEKRKAAPVAITPITIMVIPC